MPKGKSHSGQTIAQGYGQFTVTGIMIFSLMLFISGLFFAYEFYLERKISSIEEGLQEPDEVFDPELIKGLTLADSRIRISERLLNNKTAPTFVFEVLEDLTAQNIHFSEFNYRSHLGGESNNMTLANVRSSAPSFSAVAYQFDVFRADDRIENVNIKNIYMDEGRVICDFVLEFSESKMLYKENI